MARGCGEEARHGRCHPRAIGAATAVVDPRSARRRVSCLGKLHVLRTLMSGRGLSKKEMTGARPDLATLPERRVRHVVKLGDVDIAR